MKKILFLLLCTVSIYGQTSTGQEQEFDYGIKNNSTQTITTPTYLTTTGTDGTQGKIPSALIAKTSDIADSLATKENIANKSDSYTVSSSTTYASTKAIVDGLATKQNTLTNPITGTGTTNTITKFTASGTVGNSTVYDNGTNIGIGTTNPVAKLHVGNGTANNSGDSQILISRLVDNSVSGNGHAFSDSSNITRDGTIGYNSFDSRVSFSGTANFDHYAGFQYSPAFDSSGVITNSYGFYAADPSGTGVLINNYGLYVTDLTKGTKNYAVYTAGTTPVYFGGNVGIGSGSPGLGGSIRAITIENSGLNYGAIQFHVKSDSFVPDIDIDGVGWFIGSASPTKVASISGVSSNFTENSAHLSFKTANLGSLNEIMRITDIGKIGIDTTTPSAKLVVNSGELLVNTNVNNGVDKLQVNGTISATAGTTANQVVVKSQLDAKVSLTGNETISGVKTLDNGEILFKGQGSGAIGRLFKQNDIFIFGDNNYDSFASLQKSIFSLYTTGNNRADISALPLTTNRLFTLPDASGTIALVETVKPYKVYTALLSQSGTSAPTATVLENTLGGTVVWTRSGIGSYQATLTGSVYTSSKTVVFATIGLNKNLVINGTRVSDSVVSIMAGIGDLDSTNMSIEIRVYN